MVTSRRFGAGATSYGEAWGGSRPLAGTAAGGLSAGLGCLSRSTQAGQKAPEGPLDAPRAEAFGGPRPLPGQPLVGHQGPGQPELPEDSGHQPAPAVGGRWVAGTNDRPTQAVFGKPESMFDGEAPPTPAPELVQVVQQRAADPGQPQRGGRAVARQVLDLHGHDRDGRGGGALDVPGGPGVHCHGPVGGCSRLTAWSAGP